jgi:hypothetical protein
MMGTANVEPLKAVLRNQLLIQYGELRSEPMKKANFLRDLWRALASFTQNNRENSLIHSAVLKLEHGDLVPRAFLILSVLYGSYNYEPEETSILKDFISILDEDLDEEELRVCIYANKKVHAFFPELHRLWQNIREVYGMEGFDLRGLPPTPYYAYSLFVLNRPEDIGRNLRRTTLFGELSILHHQMQKIFTVATPEANPNLKFVR